MGRATISMVLFFVCLSTFANVLVLSGAAADLGLAPNPGGGATTSGEAVNQSQATARNISGGGQAGGTLVSLFQQSAGAIGSIVVVVFRGPIMLERIGMPAWIPDLLLPVIVLMVGFLLIYVLTGRDL